MTGGCVCLPWIEMEYALHIFCLVPAAAAAKSISGMENKNSLFLLVTVLYSFFGLHLSLRLHVMVWEGDRSIV